MDDNKLKRRKRIVAIVTFVLAIIFLGVLTYYIGRPLVAFVSEPAAFRQWVDSYGAMGVFIFMGINMLQVFLAIIPGGPFEVAAGYAFGVVKGAIICDISMSLASLIIFCMVKWLGMRFVELFVDKSKLDDFSFLRDNIKSKTFLFFFYLIPGLPKDLMSYASGLTKISIPFFIMVNVIGRFPAILMSTIGGSAISDKKYEIFIIMTIITVILYIVGLFIYKKRTGDIMQ